MILAPGSSLAHYRISAKLGEGGMGEVWSATDTRLDREVAIKVLPAAFTADKERLARFEREAKLLAQLNHPNIAQIYGLETSGATHALVMELVAGPTLAERLESGAFSLTESFSIALQIARALEEAHEKGIVHRDLKPQNVKASSEGRAKVLDFGLAKAMESGASGSSAAELARSPTLMHSPTLTAIRGTELGMILGTAAYMAPEQAKGKTVDKRADIWAFGVVLFEMLTGRPLFGGETASETIAEVLKQEIDFASLPAALPAGVERLLRRCLERDPQRRLRDIGEARIALEQAIAQGDLLSEPQGGEAASPAALWRRALPWALAGLLAVALGALWFGRVGRSTSIQIPTTVLAVRLPAGVTLPLDDRGIYGQNGILAISRDGRRLAFIAGAADATRLYTRELGSPEVTAIEGTSGASTPFFSPDGRWIGFFVPGKLRKIAVAGGKPIDLADASLDRGAVWCPDGSIVFPPTVSSGLVRLPAGGGPPQPLTELDAAAGERTHRWPALLPDGREVAFTVGRVGQPGDYEDSAIDAVDLTTGKRRPLFRGASMVRFTSTGLALLGREGQLLALPVPPSHAAQGESVENAIQVLQGVAGVPASGVVHFDVSDNGTMVYVERDPGRGELELAWMTRTGALESLGLPPREYQAPKLSPDGRRIAVGVGPGGGRSGDVWIHELASGGFTRLTFEGRSWTPIWTRDGREITYSSLSASGGEQFKQRPADGSAEPKAIRAFENGLARQAAAWMPDGSLLSWEDGGAGTAGNLVYFSPGAREALPFARTPAIEIGPAVSPDGRYVAYTYDGTGLRELHVQAFPPSGANWQVASGGSIPLWSTDGRELFFLQGRTLMVTPVSTSGTFTSGAPKRLFEVPPEVVLTSDTSTNYDIASDGRFLVVRQTSTENMAGHLVVAQNWFETLRKTLAAGR